MVQLDQLENAQQQGDGREDRGHELLEGAARLEQGQRGEEPGQMVLFLDRVAEFFPKPAHHQKGPENTDQDPSAFMAGEGQSQPGHGPIEVLIFQGLEILEQAPADAQRARGHEDVVADKAGHVDPGGGYRYQGDGDQGAALAQQAAPLPQKEHDKDAKGHGQDTGGEVGDAEDKEHQRVEVVTEGAVVAGIVAVGAAFEELKGVPGVDGFIVVKGFQAQFPKP